MTHAIYPCLKDRVVIVTGGGSGIGASIVEHFCAQGSKVGFLDIQTEVSQALVNKIAEQGHLEPLFVECDLTDIAALRQAVDRIRNALGPIQVLVNNAAHDLGPHNIRVNCILPGWIMTQRQIEKWLTPESEAELMKRQCLKRKLYPEDTAKVVLFFAADDSGGCTNQNYIVDGGWVQGEKS